MKQAALTCALLLVAVASSCRDNAAPVASKPAETNPAIPAVTDAQIPDLLHQLEGGDSAAASERLLTISPPQLVPLYDALDSPDAADSLKTRLLALLPRIHEKLRHPPEKSDVQIDQEDDASRIEHYQRVGNHSPAWDVLALNALKSLGGSGSSAYAAAGKFKDAVDAGCTDPLIRYYYFSRYYSSGNLSAEVALPALDKIASDMDASDYEVSRKFYANYRLVDAATESESTVIPASRIDGAIARALTLLPEMFKHPLGINTQSEAVGGMITVMRRRDPKLTVDAALGKVLPSIRSSFDSPAQFCAFTSNLYRKMAFDARGNGLTVTPAGWEGFAEFMELSEAEALKGWKMDPSLPDCATAMIVVCQTQGRARPEMEKWFRRAIFADPDNYRACHDKEAYLLPQWRGSREEVLAFGRECVAMGNSRNRIPYILIEAHNEMRQSFLNVLSYDVAKWEKYPLQPGVWEDYKSAYDKLLSDTSRLEDDRAAYLIDRALYVRQAYFSQKYAEQLRLMADYRDDVDFEAFGSKSQWNGALGVALQYEMAHPTTTAPKTEIINGIQVTR